MDSEWIKSPTARRILAHWADRRPTWLWSADGRTLLWHNPVAPLLNGKLKKHGLKLSPEAVPIKGQIARLIRLGSTGRSSLSRMQFLAGGRPISATCTVTPLDLPDRQTALLIVAVDPVDADVVAAAEPVADTGTSGLLPEGSEFLVLDAEGKVRAGSETARARFAPALEAEGLPDLGEADSRPAELDGETLTLTRYPAAPDGGFLMLLEPRISRIEAVRAEEGLAEFEPAIAGEAQLPAGLPAPQDDVASPGPAAGTPPDMDGDAEERSLSSLFDRLAGHEELYAELPPEDTETEADNARRASDPESGNEAAAPEEHVAAPEEDIIAAVIEFADDVEDTEKATDADEPAPSEPEAQYRVIGRGFTPLVETGAPAEEPAEISEPEYAPAADSEVVERVSRYNFDELSRILADRVSGEATANEPGERQPAAARNSQQNTSGTEGSLINIAAETFILNRLPLGIMVFRDQQVLFANRALTDLTGYESIDSLRAAGLAAIFPQDAAAAGPVTHLLRRDGSELPVTARLQSITWHGRPALMLSANLGESSLGHESAVRTFAELLAETGKDGFVTTDRAGVVTMASLQAGVVLGRLTEEVVGQPLSTLISPADTALLRDFLEQPARFAETSRPGMVLRGSAPGTELLLFAEGQAGIVTGYFGVLRSQAGAASTGAVEDMIDPSMLARVSRGVRRPLNTIVGFADLIRSAAFGTIENQRYLEYARDIRTAGQEIAVLVDELDDFAKLREGRYATRPAELDLGGLLESCIVRVRGQANAARVLVRSGISERLPRIRADRASLGQAVLNLLASAIDQSPAGGSVILSAQTEDDGSIVVNVRDSATGKVDLDERFVVFRDGLGKDGEALAPVRSSVGLGLTRALLSVNGCALAVEPNSGPGTLFSLLVPAEVVAARVTTA